MRPLPPRPLSVSARWALRLALFAPVLGIMSVLSHRGGWVSTPEFLVLLRVVAGIAFFSLLLCAIAIRSLWVKGTEGGRRASWAIAIAVIVLSPFIWSQAMAFAKLNQSDVSTDVADPPLFEAELEQAEGKGSAAVAAGMKDGYTELTGRRYRSDLDTVLDAVVALANATGVSGPVRRGRIGADDELFVEFGVESLILKMPGEVVVRISDEGETSLVDIRSRSIYGKNDRGANAELIRRFYSMLDDRLIGVAGS